MNIFQAIIKYQMLLFSEYFQVSMSSFLSVFPYCAIDVAANITVLQSGIVINHPKERALSELSSWTVALGSVPSSLPSILNNWICEQEQSPPGDMEQEKKVNSPVTEDPDSVLCLDYVARSSYTVLNSVLCNVFLFKNNAFTVTSKSR